MEGCGHRTCTTQSQAAPGFVIYSNLRVPLFVADAVMTQRFVLKCPVVFFFLSHSVEYKIIRPDMYFYPNISSNFRGTTCVEGFPYGQRMDEREQGPPGNGLECITDHGESANAHAGDTENPAPEPATPRVMGSRLFYQPSDLAIDKKKFGRESNITGRLG